MATTRKVIIIGSGPAGYTAAIYAARANLSPVMFTGLQAGGQLMLTTLVENYPGFVDGIDGPPLMESFEKQAQALRHRDVRAGRDRAWTSGAARSRSAADDTTLEGHTVIIATGASAKLIGLDSETSSWAAACRPAPRATASSSRTRTSWWWAAVTPPWRRRSISPDSGARSRWCTAATACAPRRSCRSARSRIPKISFIWDTVVDEVLDPTQGKVTAVRLRNLKTGAQWETAVDGLFVAIGHQPNTADLQGPGRAPPERVHQGGAGDDADLGTRRLRRG